MSITSTFMKTANRVKNVLVKHGPKIAVGVGSCLVVGGTVDACYKTLKAADVIDEHNVKMDKIHKALELAANNEVEYSDNDKKKDTVKVYAATAANFAKLYWRPVLLIGGGFASIFAGFKVLNARHVAAIGAFATVSDQFNEYRGNVISAYGEDADKKMLVGEANTEKAKLLVKGETDEEGNPISEDKEVEVDAIDLNSITQDDFVFNFNYKCKGWDNHFLLNENYLIRMKEEFQSKFDRGIVSHVFVEDLWRYMGYYDETRDIYNDDLRRKLSLGGFYGWMNDHPGAVIDVSWEPYIIDFSADEACDQFPMIIPIDVTDDKQYTAFRNQYVEDERKVGYLVWFNVDTDENGVPREIYRDVYGRK